MNEFFCSAKGGWLDSIATVLIIEDEVNLNKSLSA